MKLYSGGGRPKTFQSLCKGQYFRKFLKAFILRPLGLKFSKAFALWANTDIGTASRQELTKFAIFDDGGGAVTFGDPFDKVSAMTKVRPISLQGNIRHLPNFRVSMRSMGILDGLLALMSEKGKDGGARRNCSLATNRVVDSLLTETADSVLFEIRRGRPILRVLEATDPTSSCLALECGTGEEMAQAAIVVLD
jgi:hypothetical protein